MAQYEHNSGKFGYINLEDFEGVQEALAKLGFDPGEIDGRDGPKTQKAVREFQAHASIGIDGKVGPKTRQALMDELTAQAGDT
jgi:peptidoglycan hydrolase-like protein with peptidoglycan-binding domain